MMIIKHRNSNLNFCLIKTTKKRREKKTYNIFLANNGNKKTMRMKKTTIEIVMHDLFYISTTYRDDNGNGKKYWKFFVFLFDLIFFFYLPLKTEVVFFRRSYHCNYIQPSVLKLQKKTLKGTYIYIHNTIQ